MKELKRLNPDTAEGLTDHLVQQWPVALPEQDAQIQDLWNVEQEVVVDDLCEHGGREEVLLQEQKEKQEQKLLETSEARCSVQPSP